MTTFVEKQNGIRCPIPCNCITNVTGLNPLTACIKVRKGKPISHDPFTDVLNSYVSANQTDRQSVKELRHGGVV